MLTGKYKIYWIIRKLLGYVLWLEVVWLVINCVSPWKLRSDVDIIVVYTLPWILLFFLIRYIKRRWKEEGNAAIGCLYTMLWVSIPFIIIVQLLFGWLGNLKNDSTKITFEDDKYRVTELYGFFTTNSDNVRIEEHWGPFYREVYYGDLYSAHTNTLKSKAAIRRFLERWNKDNSSQ